ncbi:hypothetical protein BpHYR1_034672 [Brachionus plicatilis]|uniref:Uncharacterized protein n=1 Tax=Brachionus plicatilis TaxID=10195 RepID=A0A3M7S1Q3_BRAPC|nr:hypothetical protein BpHYR1_034672 [Brachionus plicatilis]
MVSYRLFKLSERYAESELSHSNRLVVRLVEEYNSGFESRINEYPTPLWNCYLNISNFFPEATTILGQLFPCYVFKRPLNKTFQLIFSFSTCKATVLGYHKY